MKRARARGFTLVELSVVVVIIGVLAVIAVQGYRGMISRGRVTEAQSTVMAIRAAQQLHWSLQRTYVDTSGSLCPGPGNTQTKVTWNRACGTPQKIGELDVHVPSNGTFQFGYQTSAGTPATTTNVMGVTWVDFSTRPPTEDWFIVHATADLDPGGGVTELVNASWSNQLFLKEE